MTAATGWFDQVVELMPHGIDRQARELAAPDGAVPFRVIHDWHEHSISPLVLESCLRRGLSVGEHENVLGLQRRSSHGEMVTEQTWCGTLEPALNAIYRHAYPYEQAFAAAAHAADTYARSHDYPEDAAKRFATHYATTNTDANVRVSCAANAKANARAYARAFARSDHGLLTRAYPAAYVRACVSMACPPHSDRSAVYARLGKGLLDSLQRCGVRRG